MVKITEFSGMGVGAIRDGRRCVIGWVLRGVAALHSGARTLRWMPIRKASCNPDRRGGSQGNLQALDALGGSDKARPRRAVNAARYGP